MIAEQARASPTLPIPPRNATAIVADARVLTLKRTLAVVRVDVTVEPSGQLVASTQGTVYVRDKLAG